MEGVGRVVEAETELDLVAGLSALEGNNSRTYAEMRDQLIQMLAHCEAYIDFEADETSDARLSETFQNLVE